MTTPTPQQATDLLAQIDSTQRQARSSDAWPLVIFLIVISAATSIGLFAIGVIADETLQLAVLAACAAWMIPAFVVYFTSALSWSRRSTMLLFTWLPVVAIAFIVGVVADTLAQGSRVTFAAAGLIWLAAPVFALLGLRR
ncbi:hypothetical protein EZE58_11725 [Brevibacterium sp. LS14]|uniref:hypothetical protein n=1 Tax=Brevibacterium TaxID=1696 RepID=UPI00119CD3AC|nr:hypothetical protein [Brevibacterium casei]MCT2359765.1 hypothetical protein [Brevibacterium casei]NJE67543.1 hypothetical protein [Brevibacterium sp. LS14]